MVKKILLDDEISHSLQRNARVCREVSLFGPKSMGLGRWLETTIISYSDFP